MQPAYVLSLDASKCLVITTGSPARCVLTYRISGDNAEGGVCYFEPVSFLPHTYRLRQQFMEKLRACAAASGATFGVLINIGGTTRIEVPRSEVLKALAGES